MQFRRLPLLEQCLLVLTLLHAGISASRGAETIWVEAEHLVGLQGSCFPELGQSTNGAWGIAGPGIAAEWTQGGESEWLSIACGPDDDRATASLEVEVPLAGEWVVWVRYRDWRERSERCSLSIEPSTGAPINWTFGDLPVIDEDDELKLLWNWAFGWDRRSVSLPKGRAKIILRAGEKQPGHRQVDAICLTTDRGYLPRHREKPPHPTWATLDALRSLGGKGAESRKLSATIPPLAASWRPKTFRDGGFLYFWNVGPEWLKELSSTEPTALRVPFNIDPTWLDAFRAAYGNRDDVPIFGDPRIVPLVHGAGPNVLVQAPFAKWLDDHPTRAWGNMMNYIGPEPLTPHALSEWNRFRDRYVGAISGENLGYFDVDSQALANRIKDATSRTEVLEILSETYQAANAAKQRTIFGADIDRPYRYVIPCQSAEMTAFAHACREWGADNVGYENQAVAPSLALRLAFLRGSARQFGGLMTSYRSCNFGDAATIYSERSLYAHPKHVFDNYYDPFSGAGMTWYKFDIWHAYMAGVAAFYHEQGFDEFWAPGGGAAGQKPLQLSPKGRLVERFLRISRDRPDRGAPYTPIAFLLDRAHGWDCLSYRPSYFGLDESWNPEVLRHGRHARMLKEWFKVAYHPFGPRESAPNTGTNQESFPGVFGDIFDVLVTSPTRREIAADYPVIVLLGEIHLTQEWGQTLGEFMSRGGTLVLSAGQASGPGLAAIEPPSLGDEAEADAFQWRDRSEPIASQRFRYRPIMGGEPLASAEKGAIASVFPRGSGRLVFLSIPGGLGLDEAATPLAPLTLEFVRQGLMPIEVDGEVEWLLNRTEKGWLVTLFNPAGANKPQHGVVVTDYAQERHAAIRFSAPMTSAEEWMESIPLDISETPGERRVLVRIPAGGVRIVELK